MGGEYTCELLVVQEKACLHACVPFSIVFRSVFYEEKLPPQIT